MASVMVMVTSDDEMMGAGSVQKAVTATAPKGNKLASVCQDCLMSDTLFKIHILSHHFEVALFCVFVRRFVVQ
jgi:hypothetical protein